MHRKSLNLSRKKRNGSKLFLKEHFNVLINYVVVFDKFYLNFFHTIPLKAAGNIYTIFWQSRNARNRFTDRNNFEDSY